jgi:hypothetical protein
MLDDKILDSKKLAWVRLSLLALSLTAGAAVATSTPYASASSCSQDCGCNGGSTHCCTLGNGADCGLTQ